MNIGQVVEALQAGKKVARAGWLASQPDLLTYDWEVVD